MRYFFLAVVVLLTAVPAMARHRVSVVQFGAFPDDGRDDTEALRRAAAYCRKHKSTTLVFPAGLYELRDDMAADIERRAISGDLGRGIEVQWQLFQPQKPYATGLDFTGSRHLIIEAEGATLQTEGWMQVLSFVRCKDIRLSGLAITYKRPAATEGRVVFSAPDHFDVSYDTTLYTFVDSIVQGRTYFYSRPERHFYYGNVGDMKLVRPGLIRVQSSVNPPVDDVLIIRYGGHYRPCIMLKESCDIVVEGVAIRSFPGMGVVGHMSHNILIDRLCVEPEPGRYSSTSTDATHFTSCSGTLTIRNSFFAGNGDDCTNVHNYYYRVLPDASDARRVEIRIEGADLHAQSLDYPLRGDTMLLVSRRDLRELARFRVRGTTVSPEEWKVTVQLDRPLGPDVNPDECFMVNYTRFPKVRIHNNRTDYNNGRAFLLKARDVEVTGNTIRGSTLSAIKLGAELSWREAGPVERVLIEGNRIVDTGTYAAGYRATGVMVSTETPEQPRQVNRGIVVRHNLFQSDRPVVMLFEDASGVRIEGNTFVGGSDIRQKNCSDIFVQP